MGVAERANGLPTNSINPPQRPKVPCHTTGAKRRERDTDPEQGLDLLVRVARSVRVGRVHYTYGVYTVHAFTVLFSCAPYLVQTRRTGYLTQLRTYYSVRSGRRYP